MVRPNIPIVETDEGLRVSGVPVLPVRVDDGREQILDVLRAGGLRFRAGGRWRFAL
ncbi:MAG: hypothetical protein WA890_19255 [Micromonospora sp.]